MEPEETVVLHDAPSIFQCALKVLSNIHKSHDLCLDSRGPSVVLGTGPVKNGFIGARDRGAKIRLITEITRQNLAHCKEFMKFAELRHLDNVRGNFSISDGREYTASAITEEGKPPPRLIYSNVREIAEQHMYFFETLWSRAAPAEQRIKEMEEGTAPLLTKIIEDPKQIVERARHVTESSKWLSVCSSFGDLQMIQQMIPGLLAQVLGDYRTGKHKGIRWLVTMGKDDIPLVKEFLDQGMQIRHIGNVPINFSVTDKEFNLTVDSMEGGKVAAGVLASNDQAYIRQFNSLFEELWKSGVDALERIKEIEEGIESAKIEIIRNQKESLQRAWGIVSSAKQEVQLMFSTANAFRRQLKMGGLDVIIKATENGAKVRILIPDDELIDQTLARAKEALPAADIRTVDKSLQTRITILVADQRECMVFELKDDTTDDSLGAVGITTYSNSHSLVFSYSAIFDSLWKQSELYEQLKVHDKMQKEFINIAAHELRTPVQPILVMTELLESSMGERKEDIRLIARNARRLERLTENILDVTRIESQSFRLEKKPLNLKDIVLNVIEDYEDQIKGRGVKVNYQPDNVFVQGDRERLSQVLSNLVSNALKFTHEGTIDIMVEEKDGQIIVRVKDTGAGVDAEIFPRLFTKFATKSDRGTGLGLFISKSIIEAHGGRIWAENNKGRGVTFYFSLPSEPG